MKRRSSTGAIVAVLVSSFLAFHSLLNAGEVYLKEGTYGSADYTVIQRFHKYLREDGDEDAALAMISKKLVTAVEADSKPLIVEENRQDFSRVRRKGADERGVWVLRDLLSPKPPQK